MNRKRKTLDCINIAAITVSIIVLLAGLAGILAAGCRDYSVYGNIVRSVIAACLFAAGFTGLNIQLLICNIKTVRTRKYDEAE